MLESVDARDPLDLLAEEFLERRRRGETPSIAEFATRHPQHAQEIRDLLGALLLVEELKPESNATIGRDEGRGGPSRVIPDRLGDFQIIREIGRGGMGIVYEAEQISLGRRVALKVLFPRAAHTPQQVRRFHREARSAAQLHHSNIVPVFGVGEHDGHHYYAMQYIRGLGLDRVLEDLKRMGAGLSEADSPRAADSNDSGSSATDVAISLAAGRFISFGEASAVDGLPESADTPVLPAGLRPRAGGESGRRYAHSVARIGAQVADALRYAHDLGVLHRDIKPSNLLLDGHGTVWITDFGLAKALEDDDLTESGDLVGTLRYMSPERFKGQNDARSDLYALGLTLYELLALRPAFEAKDRERLMYQIAHVRPDPVRKHNPEVPRDLETIIAKSTEQRPADRYQTAAAFGQDLRRFLDDRPIHARRVTTSERIARWARRNPGVAGLAAALVASLAVIAVGASVAAIQLGIKHEAAVRYLNDALHAQDDARRKLWEADLARVHATRQGKALGQRFEGLRVVREAVAIGVNRARDRELRNEAIACLALADLRIAWSQAIEEQAADLSILFDSDFTRYAQAHHKGEVSIHDKEDGRVLARLPGEGKVAAPIRWSADGRFLAARYEGGRGTEVQVWNLDTNQQALPALQGVYAHAFDFDSSGKLAASGHRDGSIRIHDLETGREVRRIGVGVVPYMMRFHPSLRQLAIGCAVREAAVQLLDIDSGQVIVSCALPSEAQALAWSPSGKRLAVGDYAGRIHVFDDLTSKAPARVLQGHYGNVASLAVHSENEILASASWDGTIRLWDLRTGAELLQAPLPEAGPLQFSRDGKYLGYGRDRTQFTYWEVATGHECRATVAPPGTGFRTESADFHPSGEFMVATNAANVRIDSPGRGEALAVLPLTGAADAVFTPDGESLITSGTTGLERWPLERAEGGRLLIGPPEPLILPSGLATDHLALGADGHTLAVSIDAELGRFLLLDLIEPTRRIEVVGHPGLDRLAISPDSRWLATGTWRGPDVRIWDIRTGKKMHTLPVAGDSCVLFAPDGKTLVTGTGEMYQFWEVGTWKMLRELPRHDAGRMPGAGAFSRDGTLLALTRTRSLVQLIDPASATDLASLEIPNPRHITALAFSPDGTYLALCASDETMRIWNIQDVRARLKELKLDWGPPRESSGSYTHTSPSPVVEAEFQDRPWKNALASAEEHAKAGRWAEAKAAYQTAFDLGSRETATWFRLALTSLAANDRETYRRICGELLRHFGPTVMPDHANTLSWTCALGPGALEDYEPALRLAESSVASTATTNRLNTLAAVLYRAGRYQDALNQLERTLAIHGSGGTADDWVFLALVNKRLGRDQEAKRWLAQVERGFSENDAQMRTVGPPMWTERLGLKILQSEAIALIESSQTGP